MYLKAEKYVSGYPHMEDTANYALYKELVTKCNMSKFITDSSPSLTVSFTVAYWRKVNQIHKWFVNNVQHGVDDCQTSYVSKENLTDLIQVCEKVLADHTKAGELLPRQEGFFFGDADYDEYYYTDLEDTIKQLEPLLELTDYDFYYHASW